MRRLILFAAAMLAALSAPVMAQSLTNAQIIQRNNIKSGVPSYYAVSAAYAAYATPTDMFSIRNPADSARAYVMRGLSCLSRSTTATAWEFYWIRRATLNTGGTPTDYHALGANVGRYDSADPAPTAVVRTYGAAPTLTDSTGEVLMFQRGSTAVLTGAPAQYNNNGSGISWAPNVIDIASPVIVRPGQELVMNGAGAALPSGFAAHCFASWSEVPLR